MAPINGKPYQIYCTPLVWLPTSVSESLSRERKRSYLPTIERGRFKSWLDFDKQGDSGGDRTIPGSLFISSRLSCASWLSYSGHSELILHDWDARTSSETRTMIQHIDNRNRDDRIQKVASNGVFSFDQKENVLYFLSPRLYTERQALALDCFHQLGLTGMAVSEHGSYVAVWDETTPEVCLVDVRNSACRLLHLRESEAESLSGHFTVCFSPDETLLGVSSYSIG